MFNKLLITAAITLLSGSSFGLNGLPSGQDPIKAREILLSQFKVNPNLEFGIFPTNSNDFYASINSYLPLMNHISINYGSLATFVQEPNINVFKNDIKSTKYKWIYVPAELAVVASEAGYLPVVRDKTDISASLITLKTSPINNWSDLQEKRFAFSSDSADSIYIYHKIYTSKLKKINALPQTKLNFKDLLRMLESNQVDAIAINKEYASQIDNNKYKVLQNTDSGVGFILMASIKVPPEDINKVRNIFIDLNQANDPLLIKSLNYSNNASFISYTKDDLLIAGETLAIKEKDYGKVRYTSPASATRGFTYVETHEAMRKKNTESK